MWVRKMEQVLGHDRVHLNDVPYLDERHYFLIQEPWHTSGCSAGQQVPDP